MKKSVPTSASQSHTCGSVMGKAAIFPQENMLLRCYSSSNLSGQGKLRVSGQHRGGNATQIISPLGLQFKKIQPKKCHHLKRHHLIVFTTYSTRFPRGPYWDIDFPSTPHLLVLGIMSVLRGRPSLQSPRCKQTTDTKEKSMGDWNTLSKYSESDVKVSPRPGTFLLVLLSQKGEMRTCAARPKLQDASSLQASVSFSFSPCGMGLIPARSAGLTVELAEMTGVHREHIQDSQTSSNQDWAPWA